jgi:4-hydroxybenzoate polyprenyltransferase
LGKLFGLILFSLGLGMVIGLLLSETAVLILVAGVCLLCGYHMFCR